MCKMRAIAEIDADITAAREELANVRGTTTEVYARIVGYYRSVRNWNKGKREEYNHRKLFVADEGKVANRLGGLGTVLNPAEATVAAMAELSAASSASGARVGSVDRIEVFTRKACPNCPPVKECVASLSLAKTEIDVDTEAGFARAAELGVFSTPTVVLFDAAGAEVSRAFTARELKAALAREPEPVLGF